MTLVFPRIRETVIRRNTEENFRMVGDPFFQREPARHSQLMELGLCRECLVFSVRSGHNVVDVAVSVRRNLAEILRFRRRRADEVYG